MKSIVFIDTEVDPKTSRILDMGAVKDNGNTLHTKKLDELQEFVSDSSFVCGHNIIHHDLVFLSKANPNYTFSDRTIDTLYLSPLLFPTRPYHALLKDDKLQTDELNNPLNDAIKAKDLFYDEVNAFNHLDLYLQETFYLLLRNKTEFRTFFEFLNFSSQEESVEAIIRDHFANEICEQANISRMIAEYPVEMAYCLALVHCRNRHSITPPWVMKNFPEVEKIMFLLRGNPCLTGCAYCNQALDIFQGLKRYFGFDTYRVYDGDNLQEKAVKSAIDNKSLLAVFPTGGGKSITFQVPALMSGEATKSLTIVISPLQSLMKDQVDNLEKIGITEAVTINGLLDPIERAKSFERVEDGSACILYISPESLRSKSIERLVLGRRIARFVIDEAHCFSSWGQDFRVDYLYIGDFIRNIQEKKSLDDPIPVSCFTATAKQNVIEDIRQYFKTKLGISLEIFWSKSARKNLHFKVFPKGDEEEKYQAVRDLIEERNCPTIIYVSRTRKAYKLAERLDKDGFRARPYHGKMESKEKTANQNAFIAGEIPIIVATSAFGMGVDKKDVGMVIHYEISDSLENYIQEAGRAGRDESITAECFVLYDEEDLSKHFVLLNQTKLSLKEIKQIWKAIKEITRFRTTVSNSALEIARKAGWDDTISDIETRVTTAIAALEDAGYLKRGQNMPRVFANSILSKTAQEAIDKIRVSPIFNEQQKESASRIIKKLFSSKSRKATRDDGAESRVDYIADHLGMVKEEVINIIALLREEKILADTKDLTAFIKKGENINRSLKIAETYTKIERFLLPKISTDPQTFSIKKLNDEAEKNDCASSPNQIKTVLNYWSIKNWIKRHNEDYSNNHVTLLLTQQIESLKEKLNKRFSLVQSILEFLYEKTTLNNETTEQEVLVEFSLHELKSNFEQKADLFATKVNIDEVEDALFYMSRIGALKIEGGFMVVYNKLTIDRIETDNKRQYKVEDYDKLNQFYENKVQQIHIVGEYAKKMIGDYRGALQFVDDYFQLNYSSFLNKYFPGSRQKEIKRNITPAKFRELFGSLSTSQLEIVKDNTTKYMVAAAGPGSGKTKVLVHKLASLLLMEDVKHEQLLMVTFSRAATNEFKKRLLALIGNAANFIEIKTFHSYCFDILGKVGTLDKSKTIVRSAIDKIKTGEIEQNRITKTVIVIDEAQDMDADEFEMINLLIEQNEDIRIVAVGDDDQNIYEFRGSDSVHLANLATRENALKLELIENYRSKQNLVSFSNEYVKKLENRLKNSPIMASQKDDGIIKLVQHISSSLVTPLVTDLITQNLRGTTCVLATRNVDALQIAGLLLKNGLKSKLIQTNDGFNLFNLQEIQYFFSLILSSGDKIVISPDQWQQCITALRNKFLKSDKLDLLLTMLTSFSDFNTKKMYVSDLEVHLRESRLEDFYEMGLDTIYVSTIHKAKGKEFDNIILMLENFQLRNQETLRQIYVAITRAKTNLTIHTNGREFEGILVENMKQIKDSNMYQKPNEFLMHIGLKDVVLDFFITKQNTITQLTCGDSLKFNGVELIDLNNRPVIRLSQKCKNELEAQELLGYRLKSARVNFILYYKKENLEKEFLVVLPELVLEKVN
ncbi:MAG: RecQ family ATP-dependent DNA helicase [Flavobacteriales bacterium]|nr:RecQ family ATP-dependent DNA helicase [Flavobacteriales bacterium]